MASELIDLNKQVFEKRQYNKTINTSFTQLVQPTIVFTGSTLPTVNEFFSDYNQLFFDIPKFGEADSHEYLIKTSEDYIGTSNIINDEIQALIDEVTELRQENLELQRNQIQISGLELPEITIPAIEIFTPEPSPIATTIQQPTVNTIDDVFLENLRGGKRAAKIAVEALEAKGFIYTGTRYR